MSISSLSILPSLLGFYGGFGIGVDWNCNKGEMLNSWAPGKLDKINLTNASGKLALPINGSFDLGRMSKKGPSKKTYSANRFGFVGDLRLGYMGCVSDKMFFGFEMRAFLTPGKSKKTTNISEPYAWNLNAGTVAGKNDKVDQDYLVSAFKQKNIVKMYSRVTVENKAIFSFLFDAGFVVNPSNPWIVHLKIGPSFALRSERKTGDAYAYTNIIASAQAKSVTIPKLRIISATDNTAYPDNAITIPVAQGKMLIPSGMTGVDLTGGGAAAPLTTALVCPVVSGPTVTLSANSLKGDNPAYSLPSTFNQVISGGAVYSVLTPVVNNTITYPVESLVTNNATFSATAPTLLVPNTTNGSLIVPANAEGTITIKKGALASSIPATVPATGFVSFPDKDTTLAPEIKEYIQIPVNALGADTPTSATFLPVDYGNAETLAYSNKTKLNVTSKRNNKTIGCLTIGLGIEVPLKCNLSWTGEVLSTFGSKFTNVSALLGLKYTFASSRGR